MWSQQGLDGENKSVMGAQLNQVSGPLKEIKLSLERGHLMRGRLADSDGWRVTLARVWGRHNICIWTGDDFSSMNPPPFCFFLSHTHTHSLAPSTIPFPRLHWGHICSLCDTSHLFAHIFMEMMTANKERNLLSMCSYFMVHLDGGHYVNLIDVPL